MFFPRQNHEDAARVAALNRAYAVIEFDLTGMILTANANFLATIGYELDEIVGRHHAMFVDPQDRASAEYDAFWERLRAGTYQAAQFRRVAKGGREIWLEASYNPLLGRNGEPYKIVKIATDVTDRMREDTVRAGRLAAMDRSQAMIAFTLDGTVIEANANFLKAMGYSIDEVVGRPHRMFVDDATAASSEYAAFWTQLRRGEFQAGQFKRLGKNGREVWIEASYNPVFDTAGQPVEIVKYATDITAQVRLLSDLQRLIETNFREIDAAVAQTEREAGEAAHAVAVGSGEVQAMARAVEELAASARGIASGMTDAESASDHVASGVAAANEQTGHLAEASAAMDGIVDVIRSVASQINLLALNATIEAARAGAAGRGFAVVAGEVKALAAQTAKATEQIQGEIEGVQTATGRVVTALEAIRGSTAILRKIAASATSAAQEQSGATLELSESMQGVARAVSGINGNVEAIEAAVATVQGSVAATKNAALVLVR